MSIVRASKPDHHGSVAAATEEARQAPPTGPLHAFAAYGIELEYMIVDRGSLDVRPIAPEVLAAMAGKPAASVARGGIGWSNELVQHVIEIKNVEPHSDLAALERALSSEVQRVDRTLAGRHARLMPGGMHPWMDPLTETRLWTQSDAPIYAAFDRIFDCRRHGWANLQSMHINLPFAGDAQFARLHAAIRCVLPLIPALAASSPIADGERKPALDYRLEVYRCNAEPLQAIAGCIVPEPVSTRDEYQARILTPMFREIAPYDRQGTLQHEWLNSRGAIARFDRSAIEVRVADTQECPGADLAIAAGVVAAVRMLYEERWARHGALNAIDTDRLARILLDCIRDADEALIADREYLALFGVSHESMRAGELWRELIARAARAAGAEWCREAWQVLLDHGPLARRITRAVGNTTTKIRLREVYETLCDCLAGGRLFVP